MKRNVTLKDIATKLNTSVMTISKALNNHPDISAKRKQEVLELAASMNYVPNAVAKSLRNHKSKFIAIVVGDNSNPYYARIIKGAEETLSKKGYLTLIINSQEDPDKELMLIDQLRSVHIAGVLLTPAAGNIESAEHLDKYGIPYVLVNRYLDKEKGNYVVADDYNAGYLAASKLAMKKDRDIFALWFIPKVSTAREREEGFIQALKDNGIEFDKSHIVYGCVNHHDGLRAMHDLLDEFKPPMSVICYSDFIALGAMTAIRERGLKIPDDISIIGIDDIEFLDYSIPRLSTIGIPKFRLGKRAAELLIKILNKDPNEEINFEHQIVLATELIDRDSV
jgi:DNA-binding LacI/PurR family transcriptional regulator